MITQKQLIEFLLSNNMNLIQKHREKLVEWINWLIKKEKDE